MTREVLAAGIQVTVIQRAGQILHREVADIAHPTLAEGFRTLVEQI